MSALNKWRKLLPLLLIAAVLTIGWQIFGGMVMGKYYDLAAEQAYRAGSLERAALLREKQLTQTPKDNALRLALCDLYMEIGNQSRAEYILQKGLADTGPGTDLYKALSRVFAAQNKLQDAVLLLSEISSQPVKEAIADSRPPPPEPTLPYGTYNERVTLAFDPPPGHKIYYTIDGTIPSVTDNLYTEPAVLPDGVSELRAVAVSDEGLVSEWTAGFYTLEQVVYPIEFADPAFESLVRAAIGKPEGAVFTEDLWSLDTLLSSEPVSIGTLDDIRHLPALRILSLIGTRGPCDISALSGAETLRELRLESFGLQSMQLESLSGLLFLETLNLTDNNIAMLGALSPLDGLRSLNLSLNSVTTLEGLSALTKLKILDLSGNAINDLRHAASLTDLEKLLLSDNNLYILEGIQALTSLRTLDVSGNYGLEEIPEIEKLTALEWFSAAGCHLMELPDCSRLSTLRSLFLEQNYLGSLQGLEAVYALETLNISRNQIASLAPLAGKHLLKTLDASDNSITAADGLQGLAALESLIISDNSLTTLSPLQDCPSLKEITAFDNPLTDPPGAWDGTGVSVKRY